jgi:toxin-antitoxin system PIN domain toxin
MSSLSFPDINVWLAIAMREHAHAKTAREWWRHESGTIAFSRFTQLGLLRQLTTAATMSGKPLTMEEAWQAYDWFFNDSRVSFIPDPHEADGLFRKSTNHRSASPKMWADAWLLAIAAAAHGRLVTFDKALASRGAFCLL